MINKTKLGKFLMDDSFDINIREFVLSQIETLYYTETPRDISYFIDLNLFNYDIKKDLLNEYHIIDFDYLNSFPENIIKHYLESLSDYIDHGGNNEMLFSFLYESGVLISNIEYLKKKRLKKLQSIKNREINKDAQTKIDIMKSIYFGVSK